MPGEALFAPPASVTSFLGRQAELADLRRRLGEHRLVTLVGPGGVGKTRLALQAATVLQRAFALGAGFVDLAPAADQSVASGRSRLLSAVAEAATPPMSVGTDDEEHVVAQLRRGRCLLVLDGWDEWEEGASGGRAVLGELLRRCPELVVLATARHRLGIDGESLVTLLPLQLPRFDVAEATVGAARTVESMALFEERARRARDDFSLTAYNVADVAELVRRIDGLPLGIELLAARTRVMTPRQILERLDDELTLASSNAPDVPERHRAMHRLLASSYDACTPDERVLWERMTVFSGAFDLEDVEAVCADDGLAVDLLRDDDEDQASSVAGRRIVVADVADLVTELVDRSVLTVESSAAGTSLRLLGTLRAYGAGRLGDEGEVTTMRARHAAWFGRLARRSAETWTASSQRELLGRLRAGWANLQTAYLHHLEVGRPERALDLATRLRPFWLVRGRVEEGREWLQRAMAAGVPDSEVLRAGLLCDAYLAVMTDQVDEARALLTQATALTTPPSTHSEGLAHLVAADVELFGGDVERARHEVALAAGLGQGTGGTLYAEARFVQGVLALASEAGEAGEGGAPVAPDAGAVLAELPEDRTGPWGRGWFVWLAALADHQSGDLAAAQEGATRAFTTAADLGDHQLSAWALYLLALASEQQGERRRARLVSGFLDATGTPPLLSAMIARMPTLQLSGHVTSGADFTLGRGLSLRELRAQLLPRETTPAETDDTLTPREVEVALLLGEGLSNSEVAERLVISKRTAEGHVQRVVTKLGLERHQLAAWAASRR